MAALYGWEVLHIDINAGVVGAVAGLEAAMTALGTDLLVGIDVGGDSLAQGGEAGLRSPLADAVMLAAFTEMEKRGHAALWGVFGYGSDGELTTDEIERALAQVAAAGGLLGAWALTPQVVSELEDVVEKVPTEASAVPLRCARGAWGEGSIRYDERRVRLTPVSLARLQRYAWRKRWRRAVLWRKRTTPSTVSVSRANWTSSVNGYRRTNVRGKLTTPLYLRGGQHIYCAKVSTMSRWFSITRSARTPAVGV